jgi:hypothetical protein
MRRDRLALCFWLFAARVVHLFAATDVRQLEKQNWNQLCMLHAAAHEIFALRAENAGLRATIEAAKEREMKAAA